MNEAIERLKEISKMMPNSGMADRANAGIEEITRLTKQRDEAIAALEVVLSYLKINEYVGNNITELALEALAKVKEIK